MKAARPTVTRRSLARVLALSAAWPAVDSAQDRSNAAPDRAAPDAIPDTLLKNARDEFRSAGRVLAGVKIPRSLEPAARFEA
jgi:hypothetical protein